MSRRPARFTQADIARAIRAVEQSSGTVVVDLLPEGVMRVAFAPVGKPVQPVARDKEVAL